MRFSFLPKKFLKRIFVVLLIGTSLLLLQAEPALATVEKAFDKKAVVFVTPATKSDFSDLVQYPARVRSKINAWVSAETAGQVQKILKPVGSQVHRGDVVLIIKNIDPVFKYAPVKILAPADGFITSLEIDLLTRVDRGDKLFSVTDPSSLVVDTEVPASDLHFFKIGDKGILKSQAGQEYHMLIQALSPAVDIKTGTSNAILTFVASKTELASLSQNLSQGQLGQVLFHVNPRKSFVLPESTLVLRGGGTFVRVLTGTKAKLVPVIVSLDLGDKVEIQTGLIDGQQIITRWNRFIADGEEVEIQTQDKSDKAQL